MKIITVRTTGNTVLSTFAQRGNTLVGVSDSPEFLVLNPVTGNVTRRTPCSPQTVRIHVSPSLLLSGSSDGMLRTHDLRTAMKRNSGSEHSVRAHQGSIQAIESSGNWIYTIGWSTR
jgi:PAB-dependent poly(A)-specific ribonuclease subunit 2